MALQSSGPISLNDVAGEFSGSTPHSLSEYYGVASGVPGSGTISLSDFYGKAVPAPEPEPEPEPGLQFKTTGFGGAIGSADYTNYPAFGGTAYVSAYVMGQNNGDSGGVTSAGLFTEGIGQLSGIPTPLANNAFNRVLIFPQTGNATWSPLNYSRITIGISGGGLTSSGWWVYNPVWSRYQPPGSTGFSNIYYLSSASSTSAIFGNAANGDSVATIGYWMARAIDAGSTGLGIDFHA